MGKFTRRVGQVSLRNRAIAAALYVQDVDGGVNTVAIAELQGITTRRALEVMRYAHDAFWVYSVKAPHRVNAFRWRWLSGGRSKNKLTEGLSDEEKDTAKALVSAYLRGKHA